MDTQFCPTCKEPIEHPLNHNLPLDETLECLPSECPNCKTENYPKCKLGIGDFFYICKKCRYNWRYP